jgi:hypothetical protein
LAVPSDMFTGILWRSVEDVFEAIISHPFITGLTDGSLSLEVFKEYVIQDALYLSRFSRALALVGAKAPDDESALLLISAARDSLQVERASLHDFLLKEWGIEPDSIERYTMSTLNRAYTDFLISTAYEEPFLVGLSGSCQLLFKLFSLWLWPGFYPIFLCMFWIMSLVGCLGCLGLIGILWLRRLILSCFMLLV